MLKLFIKTETSWIILLESQNNNDWFFPQGRDFVLEEKRREQPGPKGGEKGKPEIRAEKRYQNA